MMAKAEGKTEKEKPTVSKEFIKEHMDGKEIDLSMCSLSKIPVKELASLSHGVVLDLSRNSITVLPENFATLTHLLSLDLSSNQLTELPENFGHLSLLQRLDLYSNKLKGLPLSFAQLKQLKWLDLKNNELQPELAAVAGTCVDEKECKECAQAVLKYMKEAAAEAERKRQKELERQRMLKKQEKLEEEKRQAEMKRQRAEEKKRRKEEFERLQALKKAQEEGEDDEEEEEEDDDEEVTPPVKKTISRSELFCIIFTIIVVLVSIFLGFMVVYCHDGGRNRCPLLHQALNVTGIMTYIM